jgi:hypothetical protein
MAFKYYIILTKTVHLNLIIINYSKVSLSQNLILNLLQQISYFLLFIMYKYLIIHIINVLHY